MVWAESDTRLVRDRTRVFERNFSGASERENRRWQVSVGCWKENRTSCVAALSYRVITRHRTRRVGGNAVAPSPRPRHVCVCPEGNGENLCIAFEETLHFVRQFILTSTRAFHVPHGVDTRHAAQADIARQLQTKSSRPSQENQIQNDCEVIYK